MTKIDELAESEAELRAKAKYTQADIDAMGKKGEAFGPDADGHYSYPIGDAEDLGNAIHAVGRGNADHDKIRAYIIRRADALGASDEIPDNWNTDGSLSDAKSKPTPEDAGIAAALGQAKVTLSKAKALQLADPDNMTDPDDEAVMSHINEAEAALDQAISAQVKDGHPDPKEKKSAVPAVPRRYVAVMEREVPIVAGLAVRAATDADAQLVGWPSTVEQGYAVTDWLGDYTETISRGAFSKTLGESDYVPMLFDHDGMVLSAWRRGGSGTLDLCEDQRGLRSAGTVDIVGNDISRSVVSGVRRGDLDKMSFAFRAIKDAWSEDYLERSVSELQLFDVSIVKFPANPNTSVSLQDEMRSAMGREGVADLWTARSALDLMAEQRDVAEILEPALERAMRAIRHADEALRSRNEFRFCGRSRTFMVVGLMEELRAGKVLSAKNQKLLQSALETLNGAQKAHAKVAAAHEKASNAIADVLPNDQAPNASGEGSNNGPSNGSPINPQDGAGPRSIPPSVQKARRELELLKLRLGR